MRSLVMHDFVSMDPTLRSRTVVVFHVEAMRMHACQLFHSYASVSGFAVDIDATSIASIDHANVRSVIIQDSSVDPNQKLWWSAVDTLTHSSTLTTMPIAQFSHVDSMVFAS
jgi:hypothetical protein